MRKWIMVGLIVLAALVSTLIARSFQSPAIRTMNDASLREYAGVYQWDPKGFLYLQMWPELTGINQLVAFDETGELRALVSHRVGPVLRRSRCGSAGGRRVANRVSAGSRAAPSRR